MNEAVAPVPFKVYEKGVFLHGTKADLGVGDLLIAGRKSNFEAGRAMNYVYFTATLDAAVWGAELATGEGRGIYFKQRLVPFGEFIPPGFRWFTQWSKKFCRRARIQRSM